MKTLLEIDLSAKTASENGGGWSPSPLTFGETLTLALRPVRTIGGATSLDNTTVLSLQASIGLIDAPPTAGKTCLKIAPEATPSSVANTTAEFPFNITATGLEAKINTLSWVVATYGLASVSWEGGSFEIVFGAGAVQVPLALAHNRLRPVSFGQVSAGPVDGQWIHSLRLMQTPVAFTDAAPRILPPQPSIVRIQGGGTIDDFKINEVQELTVPPEFLGSYQINQDLKKSELLSLSDGIEEIQAAMVKINADFLVSAGLPNKALIEFAGGMSGLPFDLLTTTVQSAPPGDLTIALPLDKFELYVAMRGREEDLVLPLDVTMVILEDGVAKSVFAFRQDLTFRPPLIWPSMALIPGIDWLRSPSPTTYLATGLATVTLPDPLPAAAAGNVWQNLSGNTVIVPGGGQTGSGKVANNGFVASDGRLLYGAVNDGVSKSYYPAAMEQTLFTLEINNKMLRLNGLLELQFSIVAQILKGNCQGQWFVVVEVGAIAADTTPSPIGFNLKEITWSTTPILSQAIYLTEVAITHSFGARIRRRLVSLVDTMTADKMSYGVWEGANAGAPATANFALRARLANFDAENIADPRGWLHYELLGVATEDGAEEAPKATITY